MNDQLMPKEIEVFPMVTASAFFKSPRPFQTAIILNLLPMTP
jgi:hypothetical protein